MRKPHTVIILSLLFDKLIILLALTEIKMYLLIERPLAFLQRLLEATKDIKEIVVCITHIQNTEMNPMYVL